MSALGAASVALDPSAERASLSDLGNADRFARDHRDHARYCESLGWLTWDGCRWQRDTTGEIWRLGRETVKGIYAEAARCGQSTTREALAKWALESERLPRLNAMIKLAESEPSIAVKAEAFDRNRWLLNTLSGVADLKTGNCATHDPALFLTKLAGSFYTPQARCPRWLTFLDRIMGGNLASIEYLQRAVGYSLTGNTSERALFMLWGTGANGKSTFLETLRTVLGDYAAQTPAETLLVKRNSGASNDLARLRGARFVTASETDDGRRLAEALVKQITGGDTVTARFLYAEHFEFRPEYKVWLATNHKPTIRGTDHAIWDRVRLIPFTVRIPPEERDKDLGHKLREESTDILGWAVEGCLQWQKVGLAEPEAVKAATETYRKEMDTLATFIEERCEVAPGLRGYAMHAAYQAWAKDNGGESLDAKKFSRRLQERGHKNDRDNKGRYFEGLRLMTDDGA